MRNCLHNTKKKAVFFHVSHEHHKKTTKTMRPPPLQRCSTPRGEVKIGCLASTSNLRTQLSARPRVNCRLVPALGAQQPANQHRGQPAPELALNLKNRLAECITPDDSGRQRLTITLPNAASLDSMANALARLLSVGDAGGK